MLTAADELDGGALLPGLRLAAGALFQGQPSVPFATAPTDAPGVAKVD